MKRFKYACMNIPWLAAAHTVKECGRPCEIISRTWPLKKLEIWLLVFRGFQSPLLIAGPSCIIILHACPQLHLKNALQFPAHRGSRCCPYQLSIIIMTAADAGNRQY